MSFLTVVEAEASAVETAVVSGLKDAVTYVDNVVVHDILPVLESALLQAIEKFGQDVLASLLPTLVPPASATVEPVVTP